MNNFTANDTLLYSNGTLTPTESQVPDEIAISLTVNGVEWLTFICSPFQVEELAVGFLFNEGFIKDHTEIVQVWLCANKTNVDVWLTHAVSKPEVWQRTSGCTGGLTASNAQDLNQPDYGELICPDVIIENFSKMLEQQKHYRNTRGIHCAMLTNGEDVFYVAEDIGRHNCIDKLAGLIVLQPRHFERKMILTTGRISSEMLQKSAKIGANVVVSRTSPTKSSVQTAEKLNITLIGYARRNQFTVYSHAGRIVLNKSESSPEIFCY